MPRPRWHVTVATDDGRILDLSINGDTGQLFIGVSESQRPSQHVATFNRKTLSLDNLVAALIEGSEQFDELAPGADNEQLAGAAS